VKLFHNHFLKQFREFSPLFVSQVWFKNCHTGLVLIVSQAFGQNISKVWGGGCQETIE